MRLSDNIMFLKTYHTLLKEFGHQEWWPVHNITEQSEDNAWEICVGTILTQNTAWTNVEKALDNLIQANTIDVHKIANMPLQRLQKLIKPSGFYKQKALRLKRFAKFVLSFDKINVSRSETSKDSLNNFIKNITREQLLAFNGIGPETADSILLYACNKPCFVIDAYTRRIFSRIGIKPNSLTGKHKHDYDQWRMMFEQNIMNELQRSSLYHKNSATAEFTKELVKIYKEYHALIVELAKRSCRSEPDCVGCILEKRCKKGNVI